MGMPIAVTLLQSYNLSQTGESNMEKENILIVDDDPSIMDLLKETVSSYNFACLTASDGSEALDCIQKNDFYIVVSDINLPHMSGLDLMDATQKIKPEIPFLIITGYDMSFSYDQVINAGANDFIVKPFSMKEFANKLMRIIEERRLGHDYKKLLNKQTDINRRLSKLLDVASTFVAELNFDRLFPLIIGKVTEAMLAERTSLYIIDWDKGELWTKVAEGVDQIRLPLGQGISGRVAQTGEQINIPDAWKLPYFNMEFDKKHNFRTMTVLCQPIKNLDGKMIGVLQVINKKGNEAFNNDDELFLTCLASHVGIALDNSLLHEELRLSFESSINTLSAIVDAKHHLTCGHSQRVTEYTLMIAKEMGIPEEDLDALRFAALLHDIGKIGVRDSILLKNGTFTEDERVEMNLHASKTKEILDNFRFPRALQSIPDIASKHHEKINGKGYPEGLTGDQMPLGSKIIAVADVFDALTSPRDYPKYDEKGSLGSCAPMPLQKAISILKDGAGEHFDPSVVDAFMQCLPSALLCFRNSHFASEYVDDTIRLIAPDLLN